VDFSDLIGKATGGGTTGGGGLAASLLEMLNNRPGGIAGLVQSFQEKGLGGIASSWVGTGENKPVSADQVQQVLGDDEIQDFAEKSGVPPEEASSQLAQLLPGVVDRLTPNGEVPQGSDLMSTGMGLLKGLFKSSGA